MRATADMARARAAIRYCASQLLVVNSIVTHSILIARYSLNSTLRRRRPLELTRNHCRLKSKTNKNRICDGEKSVGKNKGG
jgi:hypothetical protein